MGRYKKGVNTCSYIILVSKKLFSEQGYSKTTIQEVCDECNITLGNFTYYFKTKQELLEKIYEDFIEKIEIFIDDNFSYDFSFLEKFTLISFIYHYKILQDETSLNFHHKILNDNNLYKFLSNFLLENLYMPNTKNTNLSIDEKQLKLLFFCNSGMNREIIIKYIETGIFSSHLDFCLYSSNLTSALFKFDNNFMIKFLDQYPEFVLKLKSTEFGLLK